MPVQVRSAIGAWLKELGLVQNLQISEGVWEISYNDQIYLQNGYLIGRLLRSILKSKGMSSEALMRIRKIAHISSNENWMIIKEIMQELQFQEDIDPHAIDHAVIAAVLEFVYELFAPKVESKVVKREKKVYIDPASFAMGKPIEQSQNLLEMFLLAAGRAFGVGLGECLGLLVSNGKYFKKAVMEGTTSTGYTSVCQFYKLLAQNMVTVNRLIAQQLKSQAFLMNTISIAAYSPQASISDIFSVVLSNLQSSQWLEQEGYVFLLRSPHDRILDLLMKRVEPVFGVIFNQSLCEKLTDRCSQLRTYCRVLHYLYKSMFGREIFELLPLGYYLQRAFEIFEPDRIKEQSRKALLAAKQLCKVAITYFWSKITLEQRSRICFIFDCSFCSTQQQRLTSLCYLFDVISELSIRQAEHIPKFYKILNKYYSTSSLDVKSFIIQNLHLVYTSQPDHFPVGFFLETYQISNPVQGYDYMMVDALAGGKGLEMVEVVVLLKICTIYYYQQLHAACFIAPMEKLVRGYGGVQWGQQVSQEILIKWPTLPIPTFQLLPPNTNKIKFRSIGLKKKQMLQFTELNRYKSILRLLTSMKDRQFLKSYARLIITTMKRVQKSKMRQMQNTKAFLNSLLALVDSKQIQIKQQKQLEVFRAQTMPMRASDVGDELQSDSFLNQYEKDDNQGYLTPIQQLASSQNEFMRPPVLPKQDYSHLLPFSGDNYDQTVKDYTEDGIYENYQLIYIKSAAVKYKSLLAFVAKVYEKSGNMEHFLKSINLYSYFSDDIPSLQTVQKRLKMVDDSFQAISFKLTLQMGLSLFQFKKSRRITIKCLQSFYQLLMEKCNFQSQSIVVESINRNEVSINAKIDFKHQIANKILVGNKQHHSYMICFQVISDILKKSIGVAEVEPISCLISQIMPIVSKQSSPQSLSKSNLGMSQLDLLQQRQFEQLQKMLQDQSSANTARKNKMETPSKQKKGDTLQTSLNKGSNKSDKLSIIHKKVSLRRKQLEGRVTKALNQT